ncbi:unnamed protein product [Durusdinium trenchii]|uniref:Aminoglycoside phosphotransferase domain-containing protein n=1 Tax=Durusdinium trenchii TaxID=1381693 RepID=A0ABP0K5R0_9DINO
MAARAEATCFLQQLASSGVKWEDFLHHLEPCVDQAGFLAGGWGNCLVEATIQEHTHGNFGQAGQVIDFLSSSGHQRYMKAADKLERLTHRAMRAGGIQSVNLPRSEHPQAWGTRGQDVPQVTATRASSSSSSSSTGSSSSGERKLDAESKALCRSAPEHARIDHILEKCIHELPVEIIVKFSQRGSVMTSSKRLKSSFHSTWLVEISPLIQDGKSYDRVIVQILGSQVGDQPLSVHISCKQIVKAMDIARRAGVRVPDVLFTGSCDTYIGPLEFIVQEYISTQTVEDVVKAPAREWNRIEREVVGKLQAFGLGEDATPMQSFESLHQYLMYFRNLVPTSLISIREEIDNFVQGLPRKKSEPLALLHQDINCGNLLTSEVDKVSNSWRLDAVIDWESAVIAPGELLCRPLEDHWRIAMAFGQVAKGAWLAGCLAEKALPRCDLEALVENYTRAAKKLEKRKHVRFEKWSSLVQKCQTVPGQHFAM